MYDTERGGEKNNNKQKQKHTQKQTKREIFTGKMDLRGRKKDYEISRMKKGPIDINIKIKKR